MTTQTQLRIGKIRYLNCLPFYFGLAETLKGKEWEQGVSFLETYPAAINDAMQRGEIDLAPISSMEYLQHQDDYLLLGFGIGARLFSRSVLLLSRKKLETLDGAVIALSKESLSSVTLARILLKGRYDFTNTFETVEQNPEAMLQKYPAAIVIGDQALFCQPKDMVYKYDLAELWQQWTGKPFVFALWAVRKAAAEQYPVQVAAFRDLLRENLLKNLSDPEGLLKQALEITPDDRRFCQLLGYFVNLQYELTSDMNEGVARFFELAHEQGLSPLPQPLRFLE
ncbi:MAG TPA: menaquinone biosynthesis protein [Candidatus Omnitrophota bacterium]|nr:menaquinone biosynthesis protein [Candidatus Omnitrophota bacterium]HPS37474.1 menaquinone biosynthesis protein [Candidatus Omnitrophota bacterium]